MKVVGIDIGSYSIKIVELSSSRKSYQINQIREYPLSFGSNADREIELISSLREILFHYTQEENIKFVVALQQENLSFRQLEFPFKEKFKILKSLPFELEDLTPLPLEDSIFDAKILERFSNGSQVLGFAAPKELIKKKLSFFKDLQIEPDVITAEGLALNNLFEDLFSSPPSSDQPLPSLLKEEEDEEEADRKSEPSQNQITSLSLEEGEAILELGHESSLLLIRSQKRLRALRKISWGAKNLIHALAQKKGMQDKEALEKIKASKGILLNKKQGSESDWELSEILSGEIEKIGKTIKLTCLEVQGSHQVKVVGMGVLGGLSQLPNLGPKLTEFTHIPCNMVVKINNHPELDFSQNGTRSICLAFGLALEGLKSSLNPPLDFRKDEFAKKNEGLTRFVQDWGFYIGLGTAALVCFFVYSSLRLKFSEDLAFSSRRSMRKVSSKFLNIPKNQAKEKKLEALLKQVSKREEAKDKILNFTKSAPSPVRAIKKISERAGSRTGLPMDIKSLKVSPQEIEIRGRSKNQKQLNFFYNKVRNLAQGKKISKTQKPVLEGNEKVYEFYISFKPKKETL